MTIFAPTNHRRRQQSGFSMIEVLVTMVVVGVGLMGLIALMLKGMQASSDSAMRSIASAQAYDMADRMRANTKGLLAGSYNNIVPPGSTSSCPTITTVAPPTATALAACSTADWAGQDKCAWHNDNARLLPSGAGAVCLDAVANVYRIFVSWSDTSSSAATFSLRFEP